MNSANPQTFSVRTLGCKVNQYESQLIRENFIKNGFVEVNGKIPADVYVINTCTVTHHADRESRQLIRNFHRLNPYAAIIVTGCYVEKDFEAIAAVEGAAHIVKNSEKNKIISLVTKKASEPVNSISSFKNHDKAFVKVQDGCNNFCSFCKVPLVRGRSRSRPAAEIKKEVEALLKNGFQEIIFTGICLGEWGRDTGNLELADLLEGLEEIDINRFRIRLSSIEMKNISDRLLKKIAASGKICKHLHIPLQSGSDFILKRMNRPYTREEFAAFIMKAKSIIPELGFTTDVMVGFPGEDNAHFEDTMRLLEECRPHRIHIFTYSSREGTKAASFKENIPYNLSKERSREVDKLAKELSYEYRRGFLNSEVEVLIEKRPDRDTGLLTGYTSNYIHVVIPGQEPLKGRLRLCKITDVSPGSTRAEAL